MDLGSSSPMFLLYVHMAADIDRGYLIFKSPLLPVFNIISESKNHQSGFGGAEVRLKEPSVL